MMIREVTTRYDNLWQMPMPYIMAIHQAPTDGHEYSHYPFHLEFHPPLRKPDTLKYLAGPEIGGGSMTNESNPDEKPLNCKPYRLPTTQRSLMTAPFMTRQGLDEARQLLCALQDSIRDAIIAARDTSAADTFTDIAEVTEADTIYRIDKISEEAIFRVVQCELARAVAGATVMEGVEEGDKVTFPEAHPFH
jgi:hypothetical protein